MALRFCTIGRCIFRHQPGEADGVDPHLAGVDDVSEGAWIWRRRAETCQPTA
ncbi:MAG: hypothetical protein R3A44_12705 [Caldilineaceae bacterium]